MVLQTNYEITNEGIVLMLYISKNIIEKDAGSKLTPASILFG